MTEWHRNVCNFVGNSLRNADAFAKLSNLFVQLFPSLWFRSYKAECLNFGTRSLEMSWFMLSRTVPTAIFTILASYALWESHAPYKRRQHLRQSVSFFYILSRLPSDHRNINPASKQSWDLEDPWKYVWSWGGNLDKFRQRVSRCRNYTMAALSLFHAQDFWPRLVKRIRLCSTISCKKRKSRIAGDASWFQLPRL